MRITSKLATIALTSGLAISGLAAMAGPASAAPGGGTTANVGVNSAITMTGLTSAFTLTGIPGATVVTGTTGQSGPVTFNVQTNNNAGYTVNVQSASANMAGTGANVEVIPVTALSVRETGTTPWLPMSSSAGVLVHTQGTKSASVNGDNLSNDYEVAIPFVNSDTYTATLNYVAAVI